MTLPASSNYDWISLNNQAAATYGPFVLAGGLYGVLSIVGSSATIDFAIVGPDGSTKLDVAAQINTSGYEAVYLPPGSYFVTIGTAASSFAVLRIRH